jgi:hypothetical protein
MPRGTTQDGGNLTVLGLARRPAVLTFDTYRPITLSQKSGLVYDTNAILVTKSLHDELRQSVAGSIGIPPGLIQEPLHGVRRLIANHFGSLPTVLAVNLPHERAQTLDRLLSRLASGKQAGGAGVKGFRIVGPLGQVFGCHRRSVLLLSCLQYSEKGPSSRVRLYY